MFKASESWKAAAKSAKEATICVVIGMLSGSEKASIIWQPRWPCDGLALRVGCAAAPNVAGSAHIVSHWSGGLHDNTTGNTIGKGRQCNRQCNRQFNRQFNRQYNRQYIKENIY